MSWEETKVDMQVLIAMPHGGILMYHVKAVTNWHAIDQAYNKHCDQQPDRKQYSSSPESILCN